MAKRFLICILACILLLSALTTEASAASSNPMIIQTNGLTSILSIVSSLGGGVLLDQVPGTNIFLVNLPNLPIVSPLLQTILGIVFIEPDTQVVTPARGQMGLLAIPTAT